jgi:hypothetical protein
MSDRTIDLIRKFTPLLSPLAVWNFSSSRKSKSRGWHEIQDERRVLIIADPGAGKTFEAQTFAHKLKQRGKKAFFIRIEAINADFEQAFEVGSLEEFAAYLVSSEEAWFFLDSVDEAQLETPRAFQSAIRIFGERIHSALERAHIFITSRDDAWQALPDQTLIEQYLPYGAPPEPESERNVGNKRDPMLKVFHLAGLTENQIELFASHYGVGDVAAFLGAVQRGNLMTLAQRPFDLKALIEKWQVDQALGSRYEVIQKMIDVQLASLSSARGTMRIDIAKARSGARLLAGAVMLTGKAIICLPDGVHSPDRIDPCKLLTNWNDTEINVLLRTGIFDDIVYTSVRFRHREIRELLAAEWVNDLLVNPERRASVEHLFFRESYGEQVIVPRTRPILTWLILLDEQIRNRALALAPEIASEGGDPSHLPLNLRQTMLANIVERIATGRTR